MSSMRNAVSRRSYRERAQPLEREKWGLLEKRKDYKLRAADFKEKKKKLRILGEKAKERNPDEFSFKMMSSKTDKSGKRIGDRGNKPLNHDVVQKLKTQDAAYLRTMIQQTRKEREELEQQFQLEGEKIKALRNGEGGVRAKRMAFVGDKEEQKKFKADDWFGKGMDIFKVQKEEEDEEEDVDEASQKRKSSQKEKEAQALAEKERRNLQRKRERAQERRANYLEAVKERERTLLAAEEELEKQRAKMSASVGGVNKDGVKFKIRERKR